MKEMFKMIKCERCESLFPSAVLICGDNVCRSCNSLNDITFWYPVLFRHGVPVPKTIIIHTNINLEKLAYGEKVKGIEEFIGDLRVAIDRIGTPAFLRTGYSSNKHDWKKSCFISQEDVGEKLLSHVVNLVEHSAVMTIDRFSPCDFWAIREFIKTKPYFEYFEGEMPITKERRFFVRDGKIECSHSYWDVENLFSGIEKEKLIELNNFTDEDKKEMVKMVTYIGKLFSGYWSVDLLKGENGTWYCTDMAIGERSYHEKHKNLNSPKKIKNNRN